MLIAAASTTHPRPSLPNRESELYPDAASYLVLAYFRETNAEGLRIRARLDQAITAAKSSDASAMRAFRDCDEVITNEITAARRRAARIEDLRAIDPGTIAWFARELVQVSNAWDDLEQLWSLPDIANQPLSDLTRRGQESIKVLDAVIFTCACQTIPDELDHYLENYRIGTCLNFISTFKDQLPDEARTREVLAYLAPQSGVVCGLIDVANAKVIKADRRWWRQVFSAVAVLAAVAIGYLLIAITVHLSTWFSFSPTDWQITPSQWGALNGAYLLVLLGVLAHWVLDRVKQYRTGADVTPFSEWLLWIHVNEVPIVVRIATVWLMVGLGVAFQTFNLAKGVQPLTYFTAGYFIDSTFDALIGRFNSFIGNQDPDKKKKQKEEQ